MIIDKGDRKLNINIRDIDWYSNSSKLDDIAYYLYITDKVAPGLCQHGLISEKDDFAKKYYTEAEIYIRYCKIERIKKRIEYVN